MVANSTGRATRATPTASEGWLDTEPRGRIVGSLGYAIYATICDDAGEFPTKGDTPAMVAMMRELAETGIIDWSRKPWYTLPERVCVAVVLSEQAGPGRPDTLDLRPSKWTRWVGDVAGCAVENIPDEVAKMTLAQRVRARVCAEKDFRGVLSVSVLP